MNAPLTSGPVMIGDLRYGHLRYDPENGWSETLLTAKQRDLVTARFQSQFGVLPVADTAIAKATGGEA